MDTIKRAFKVYADDGSISPSRSYSRCRQQDGPEMMTMITATWTQPTDDVPQLIDFDKLNTPRAREAAVALTWPATV